MKNPKPFVVGIDDSKAILTILGGICREQKVEFQATSQWSEIIKCITACRINGSVLLISDYMMRDYGGVDGDCVVKSARMVFPDLPVIVYSGSPERTTGLISDMKLRYPESPIAVVRKSEKERLGNMIAAFRAAVLANQKVIFS